MSGGPPCPSTGMSPVEVNNNAPIRVNIRVKLLLGLLGLYIGLRHIRQAALTSTSSQRCLCASANPSADNLASSS